jgi:hypothetical protein
MLPCMCSGVDAMVLHRVDNVLLKGRGYEKDLEVYTAVAHYMRDMQQERKDVQSKIMNEGFET